MHTFSNYCTKSGNTNNKQNIEIVQKEFQEPNKIYFFPSIRKVEYIDCDGLSIFINLLLIHISLEIYLHLQVLTRITPSGITCDFHYALKMLEAFFLLICVNFLIHVIYHHQFSALDSFHLMAVAHFFLDVICIFDAE